MADSILITGAGSGIGLATALLLAGRGFQVFATAPTPAQQADIEAAASAHGVALRVLPLDVTDEASITRAVETVVAEAGSLYGVVHSAGLGLRGFFEDISDEELRRLYDVNVFGVMAVTRALLPHLRAARRGHILIITSAGGRIASLTLSGYCSGKFALEGFGEALSLEMIPFGIHVSLIEPGLVMSPHFTVHRGRAKAATSPDSPYYRWFAQHEEMVDGILNANRITPADVAEVIHRALVARRPRLRYVVGWRAKLLISARKYLPGESFERIYRWRMRRTIFSSGAAPAHLNELAISGERPTEYLGLAREATEPREPHVTP